MKDCFRQYEVNSVIEDISMRFKYRDAILNQIKEEINPSETDLILIRNRLNRSNLDELERTYEAFERFGVKIIMELIKEENYLRRM